MKILGSKLVRSSPLGERKQNTLLEYYNHRNIILINREIGGLGDILMHRMMFEDIYKAGLKIHFACPRQYHPAVQDHPFLDAVLDCAEVDPYTYTSAYNTTTACGRYESHRAPYADLHRSDIWSKYCGFDLKNHNMHITFTEEELQYGQKRLDDFNTNRPKVVVCPTSAMMGKNLIGVQLTGVLTGLRDMGLFPIGLHTKSIPEVEGCRIPMIQNISIRQWMSIINAANYVIAVDTAAFHLAGGLNKPLVGVFSFADGKVYGKYFDFELVQKHRDNGDWTCGPCYNWTLCPKSKESRKPCITEIASKDILNAFERLLEKYPLKDD